MNIYRVARNKAGVIITAKLITTAGDPNALVESTAVNLTASDLSKALVAPVTPPPPAGTSGKSGTSGK